MCNDSISQELYKKVIDNFTYLYNVVTEQGCIPKDIFDELSSPWMWMSMEGKYFKMQGSFKKVIKEPNA